nr:hypothetical protein 19 [bacterium]
MLKCPHCGEVITTEDLTDKKRENTVLDLLTCCKDFFTETELELVDLLNPTRKNNNALARKAFCYYAREVYNLTFKEIGDFLGLHHATVIHHVNTHEGVMESNVFYRSKYGFTLE